MTGGAPCRACARLRVFLCVAGALIAALYLQPGWATALARLMPQPLAIGVAICGAGAALFAWRLWQYRRGA